uniref:Alpha-2-macroglobulin receptor-associated protein n=1 Tax=Aceria tosichella TaxID=561515 RepID=A0A6G1SEF0_9ACAR
MVHLISIASVGSLLAIILVATQSSAKDDLPFKINKLNLIWDKAQHSLGSHKLKELKHDLLKHEPDELNIKKMKAHGQDKDGLVEATVRRKLQAIMKKYSIERYYDDIHPPTPTDTKPNKNQEIPTFRDSKLDKLWKKAEKKGFPQEQLMILHEEFQHQQDKLDEHYKTANKIEEELEKDSRQLDKSMNSIEGFEPDDKRKKTATKPKETPAEKKARLDMNIQQALKEKHGDVKKGYDQLHQKIKSGSIDSTGPFKESRVNELWAMASQSNFTQDELQSLKEELEHYEIRIEKLKHFQNQLDRHKIGTKDYGTNAEDNDESKHIKRKVEELTRKVEKADKTIVNRIVKDEL